MFDIDKEGQYYVQVDHYDQRMYPYNSKTEKILTNYKVYVWKDGKFEEIAKDFGSDWIGFQQIKLDNLEPGTYMVTVQVQWVSMALKDYTLKVYSKYPIDLFECIDYFEFENPNSPYQFYQDLR